MNAAVSLIHRTYNPLDATVKSARQTFFDYSSAFVRSSTFSNCQTWNIWLLQTLISMAVCLIYQKNPVSKTAPPNLQTVG